jgi:hypothetical protein
VSLVSPDFEVELCSSPRLEAAVDSLGPAEVGLLVEERLVDPHWHGYRVSRVLSPRGVLGWVLSSVLRAA